MSVRRFSLTVLLLTGCQPTYSRYFSSLTESWAEQTLDVAGPSITAALVIAGMTSEICQTQVVWSEISPNDEPPFSDELLDAMGNPMISSITVDEDTTEVWLDGLLIMDREDARLRLAPASTSSSFSLTAEVQDGVTEETFGSLTFTVADACTGDARWVTGNAKWTDLSAINHTITIPADETDLGLKFGCAYVPEDGTLAWSGQINEQTRRFTSAEAAEIEWRYSATERSRQDTGMQDTGTQDTGSAPFEPLADCDSFSGVTAIEWGGRVTGGNDDWSASTVVDIYPGTSED